MKEKKLQKVGLVSLGCAKNRVDSENLLGMLAERGLTIVADPAEADVIFVNTCGFIESAKQESIDAILEMAAYKTEGNLKKLFVTGCLAQRYPDALLSEIPEIDGIMGVSDYARLNEMMDDAEKGERPCCIQSGARFLNTPRILTTPGYSAFVKISDGCDNRCTYCAIPLIRGGYSSRPFDDIVAECERLAAEGVTELTLIAQDTSRYGCDFSAETLEDIRARYGTKRPVQPSRFLLPELLEVVSRIEGVHWVRVLYCYPDSTEDRLLEAIVELPKVAPYLDLPLQHINDSLLRRMNRRGSSEWIKSRVAECHKKGIIVRTTMILGFPGETDEQFAELLDFVKDTRFERLGAFTYSAEEGTPAAEMPDQIDEDVKTARLDQLMMLQQSVSMEVNEARIGTECEVLVDGEEEGRVYGRSLLEAPESDGCIWLENAENVQPGQYVRARITNADAYDLYAEIIEE